MPNDAQQTTATQSIAIALLVPSSTNAQVQRRKHFDKVGLQQLADSLKSPAGMINPILARPLGKTFEIVAGERRWQAAKLAGLETVPVNVRALDDGQVLEVQLIENLQREGLHELHEAEGYESLRKLGITAVQIAERVGKSREYVFTRLKLLALSKDAKDAFYENKLTFSTALLIARIPGEKQQKEALKALTNPNESWSFREAQEYVQREFMLRLADAPFDTGAADLVKGALPCGKCPKNTLCQPELFGDVKGGSVGVCTDPPCFRSKAAAAIVIKVEAATKSGLTVLDGAAAKRVFPYGTHSAAQGFHRLDDEIWTGSKHVKVRSLLVKDEKPALVRIHDGEDEREKLIEVVKTTQLKLPKEKNTARASGPSPEGIAQRKANAETKFRYALYDATRLKHPEKLGRRELNLIADRLLDLLRDEERKQMRRLYDADEKGGGSWDWIGDFRKKVTKFSDAEVARLLLDCVYAQELRASCYHSGKSQELLDAAKHARVDAEKVREACAPKMKAKAAAPKAKSKKPAKKK